MAKRIASSSVNWTAVQERVGEAMKGSFMTFKSQTDKYLRQVTSQPSELPKIDWGFYKSKIISPGLVDSLQKNYESFTIPYPSDQGLLSEFDKHEAQMMKKANEEEANTLKTIEKLTAELKELKALIPFSEMSLEEFILANPEYRFDPENPKLWPPFEEDKPNPNIEKDDH